MATFPTAIPDMIEPGAKLGSVGKNHEDIHLQEQQEIVAICEALGAGLSNVVTSLPLDTDGSLAANSDAVIATQKATKTYADTKLNASALSIDGTLASNSDAKVPSEKAVKTYVDAIPAPTVPVKASQAEAEALTDDTKFITPLRASNILAATAPDKSANQYYSSKATCTTTLDWDNGNVQYIVLANGSQTFTFSNPKDGARYLLILKQPASGSGTVTFPAAVKWPGAITPTLTVGVNKADVVALVYDGTNSYYYGGVNLNY